MDASERHARRLNAKEVLTRQRSGNFTFPVADGTVKICGREQRLRTSTLTRERPERGEEQEVLQGKSDELDSPNPTSRLDAGWWVSKKWLLHDHRRIHLSSSRCTQSQAARAERRKIISYSVKVHRRYQNIMYVTGRNVRKTDWSLLGRGWRKRIVRCMDRIHKIREKESKTKMGYRETKGRQC